MEEAFTKIVQHVFSNWTALKLAVEHSMAGTNSRQVAMDCMNYMVQYCLYENNVQPETIQEALEDLLDQEFETICEDDSPREISQILYKFLQLLKDGNTVQCEIEYNNLPTVQEGWLVHSKPHQQLHVPVQDDSSDDSEEEGGEGSSSQVEPMEEEDPGWTKVPSRRRR